MVGGNVETSQRVVEVCIAALDLQAGSQGTMNNVIFGNATFGHYETVCGGSGAGPGYAGTDAIHSHMTNTAITDMEILERRYPVRLEEFSIRPGLRRRGRFPGGHGADRRYQFLAPLTLSLLTEHRTHPAPGPRRRRIREPAAGQFLTLPDGTCQDLPGTVSLNIEPGTTLHLLTPGGGGWGAAIRIPGSDELSCRRMSPTDYTRNWNSAFHHPMKSKYLLALPLAAVFSTGLSFPAFGQDATPAPAAPKPLKALLVLGGCCHDYAKQKDILKAGLEARANVVVDICYSDDNSTKATFTCYDKARLGQGLRRDHPRRMLRRHQGPGGGEPHPRRPPRAAFPA